MGNGSVIRVGIAEDQVIFRQGLQNLLNSFNGVEVVFAVENGQELIDKLEHENTPTFLPRL